MSMIMKRAFDRFEHLVNWFVPPKIAADREMRKQARLFLVSHICGPFIGNSVPAALYVLDPHPGYQIAVLAASISGFWIFPFLLKFLKTYNVLAIVSIQNLMFCITWGNLFCGGIEAPTLPWFLTIPLLSFFYLGSAPEIRLLVLAMFSVNIVSFYLLTIGVSFQESSISESALQFLGIVSTLAAAAYVAMMALFYAKALASQAELESEMDELSEVSQELRQATLAAERAGAAKSAFLTRIGSDFRRPLNRVIGYSALLLDTGGDRRPEGLDHLRALEDASLELLRLLNDLSDLAKVEAGQMEFYSDRFRPADVVRDVVDELSRTAAQQRNRLELEFGPELPEIVSDMRKIRVVLLHLVRNAVRHTLDGIVRIEARTEVDERSRQSMLVLSVIDTGDGIEKAHVPMLFDRFALNDDVSAGKYGGTGLGLSLSKKLCVLMGGDLSVQSDVGQGSRFEARFPFEPAESATPGAAPTAAGSNAQFLARPASPPRAYVPA